MTFEFKAFHFLQVNFIIKIYMKKYSFDIYLL